MILGLDIDTTVRTAALAKIEEKLSEIPVVFNDTMLGSQLQAANSRVAKAASALHQATTKYEASMKNLAASQRAVSSARSARACTTTSSVGGS